MNQIINKTHKKSGPLSQSDSALTQHQAVAYGLPLLAISFLVGPITVLQGIYAKYFGIALTTIAAVLFILALRGLSSPTSARSGNLFGMIGMAIAIAATFWIGESLNLLLILVGLLFLLNNRLLLHFLS